MSIFRIFVDGQLFYHPQLSQLAITEAKLSEDAENIDSLTLSAPFNHPYLNSIRPMASTIVCKKGDATVFEGRALSDGSDFYNTHTWTVNQLWHISRIASSRLSPIKEHSKVCWNIFYLSTIRQSKKRSVSNWEILQSQITMTISVIAIQSIPARWKPSKAN